MDEGNLREGTLDATLARWRDRREPAGGCLPACCALAAGLLLGVDPARAQAALAKAFGVTGGGATFANARVVLARLFRMRSEIVSGSLAGMLTLSGHEGLVLLGVNPRLLYAGAAPGRHAVLLITTAAPTSGGWAAGVLDTVAPAEVPERVTFLDPSLAPPRCTAPFARLASAFDGAGREALLVSPERDERRGSLTRRPDRRFAV